MQSKDLVYIMFNKIKRKTDILYSSSLVSVCRVKWQSKYFLLLNLKGKECLVFLKKKYAVLKENDIVLKCSNTELG